MALEKGTKAPEFTLKTKTDEGIKDVSLADSLGKQPVVLLFFPLAFSSVCQEELCSVSGGIDEYRELGCDVFAISVDSPFAQEGFAKSVGITIPLLSDFNKEVSAKYDVLYEDFIGLKGVAKRSAFVVDKKGTIVYSWSSDDPKKLPPFEEVKAAVKNS